MRKLASWFTSGSSEHVIWKFRIISVDPLRVLHLLIPFYYAAQRVGLGWVLGWVIAG